MVPPPTAEKDPCQNSHWSVLSSHVILFGRSDSSISHDKEGRAMFRPQSHSRLLYCAHILLALTLFSLLQLHHGLAARCLKNIPTVTQTQVGFGRPPRFAVVVQNSCPMCPVIDVHVKCGAFPQSLASPRVIQVVGFDDCIVNRGLPLAPLESISFNYTHSRFRMSRKSWSFQCE